MNKKFLIAMLVIFIVLTMVFLALGAAYPQYHTNAMHGSNILMLALSFIAYLLINKKIDNRPHAFVQGVYSASLLKLMVCMMAMLIYIFANRDALHKPTIFVLMGIYAVYSTVETILVSGTARKKQSSN
jgi:F0F1-type ATP synthase assembly protein I